MKRTIATLLSKKRITIPRLSPTHTKARIVRFEVPSLTKVQSYDPLMIVQCSPDLVQEENREYSKQQMTMIIETHDDGIVKNLNDHNGEWIDVGTLVGLIDEDGEGDEAEDRDNSNNEEVDGDWTWQAYLHNEDNDEEEKK